jgi:hypothetical protein
MMEEVSVAERLCFRKQNVEDSKLPVTCNHSPFINIAVASIVQNVLQWSVLHFRITLKMANFIRTQHIRIKFGRRTIRICRKSG